MGNLNILRHNIPTPQQAYDEMLGVKQTLPPLDTKSIVEIELDKLISYPNQPFKSYTNEKLEELAEDIKINGVLSPAIVRPHPTKGGYYEILAGRNRRNATELANISTMPCIIKDVDENTATLIMVNTNLNQRQELLPSEKAFAYKIQREAESNQGKRNDLVHIVHEVEDTQKDFVHDVKSDSKRNILYYIRLTYLITLFLNMVDDNLLSMRAGVELSYICEDNQKCLYDYLNTNSIKISLKQAEQLRELEKKQIFDEEVLKNFFFHPKEIKPKSKTSISIKFADIEDYTDVAQEDLKGYIIKALEFYKENVRI